MPTDQPSAQYDGEGDPLAVLRVQYREAKALMLAACAREPDRRWTGRELQALYPANASVASGAFFDLCNPEEDGRLLLDNDLKAGLRR
jgi:hypothetical protein